MEEKLYSLDDLEDKLKMTVRSLRELIKSGELVASKIGRRYIVTETNLQKFVKSNVFQPMKKQSV